MKNSLIILLVCFCSCASLKKSKDQEKKVVQATQYQQNHQVLERQQKLQLNDSLNQQLYVTIAPQGTFTLDPEHGYKGSAKQITMQINKKLNTKLNATQTGRDINFSSAAENSSVKEVNNRSSIITFKTGLSIFLIVAFVVGVYLYLNRKS